MVYIGINTLYCVIKLLSRYPVTTFFTLDFVWNVTLLSSHPVYLHTTRQAWQDWETFTRWQKSSLYCNYVNCALVLQIHASSYILKYLRSLMSLFKKNILIWLWVRCIVLCLCPIPQDICTLRLAYNVYLFLSNPVFYLAQIVQT